MLYQSGPALSFRSLLQDHFHTSLHINLARPHTIHREPSSILCINLKKHKYVYGAGNMAWFQVMCFLGKFKIATLDPQHRQTEPGTARCTYKSQHWAGRDRKVPQKDRHCNSKNKVNEWARPLTSTSAPTQINKCMSSPGVSITSLHSFPTFLNILKLFRARGLWRTAFLSCSRYHAEKGSSCGLEPSVGPDGNSKYIH